MLLNEVTNRYLKRFVQSVSYLPHFLSMVVVAGLVIELLSVDGLVLTVRGLDAIDGTPVLDIKPVMREFLPRGEVVQPSWASQLMAGYWRNG